MYPRQAADWLKLFAFVQANGNETSFSLGWLAS